MRIPFAVLVLSLCLPLKGAPKDIATQALTLENGLRVLLVSNPDTPKATAALAVQIGSLSDPEGHEGMAHFLEHLLFLGTEKYPDPESYRNYFTLHGGFSNAYTTSDHTNYHFEVDPEGLEGALDRFAQFFISPLMDATLVDRELNAIESEFQKSRENDDWREFALMQSHTDPTHPQSRFSSGNAQSLANTSRADVRAFFERYSPSLMALAVVGPQPLQQLEEWVRPRFAAIPARDVTAPDFPARYFPTHGLPLQLDMQSVQDHYRLTGYFNIPSLRTDWDAKSAHMLVYLIGQEGPGSLHAYLKEQGLIQAVMVGSWAGSDSYDTLAIQTQLTREGWEKRDQVLQAIFGYLRLLRESEFPYGFHNQLAAMAQLKRLYDPRKDDLFSTAELAVRALRMPTDMAYQADFIYRRQDPDFYFQLLDTLQPRNMILVTQAKGVFTTTEPRYGIAYTAHTLTETRVQALESAAVPAGCHLPASNPFVPRDLSLPPEEALSVPVQKGIELFFSPMRTQEAPKANLILKFRLPAPLWSPESPVFLEAYAAAVGARINALGSEAAFAALTYTLDYTSEGVSLTLEGYTDSLRKFLPHMIEAFQNPVLDDQAARNLFDDLARQWDSLVHNKTYNFAKYFINQATYEQYLMPAQRVEILRALQPADLWDFSRQFTRTAQLQMLARGAISSQEAAQWAQQFQPQPLEGPLFAESPTPITADNTVISQFNLPVNNSVYREDFVLGPPTVENVAAARLLRNLLWTPYHTEMRTNQQLGYVVAVLPFERRHLSSLIFLIQSAEYGPSELQRRSRECLATFPDYIRNMPEDMFRSACQSLAKELRTPPAQNSDAANALFRCAFEYQGQWDRNEQQARALEAFTPGSLADLLAEALSGDTHRIQSVLLYSRQHAAERAAP